MVVMKLRRGWIYREEAVGVTPARIKVSLFNDNGTEQVKVFDDNAQGAKSAAVFISKELGRDDWLLEECGFLGYRIFTEPKEEKCQLSGHEGEVRS